MMAVDGTTSSPGRLELRATVSGVGARVFRVITSTVAPTTPSASTSRSAAMARAGPSSSVTVSVTGAVVATTVEESVASAEAWSVAVRGPSTSMLSTTSTGKLIDAWPAGMVVLSGTRTRAGWLLVTVTARERGLGAPREIVAVVADTPADSETRLATSVRVNAGRSLSAMVSVAEAPTVPSAETSSRAVRSGSSRESSRAATANPTLLCPAGMTTVSGVNSWLPPGDPTRRVKGVAVGPSRDTVTVTV